MLYCVNTEKQVNDYRKLSNQFEEVPGSILTSTIQKTRIGELEFQGGIPTAATHKLLAEYRDFDIHVRVALGCMPIAVMAELKNSLQALGLGCNSVGVFMQGVDSSSLLFAANPRVIYALAWLDVAKMPIVIEVPPGMLCSIRDAAANPVGGVSLRGGAKGGRYLLVGPSWEGAVDESEYTAVLLSSSYGNSVTIRGFLDVDSGENILRNMAQLLKIYALDDLPRTVSLYNLSGVKFSALPVVDDAIFDQILRVIHYEHIGFLGEEMRMLLHYVGFRKNRPFLREVAKQRQLAEAFSVACTESKIKLYCPDQQSRFLRRHSKWFNSFDDGFLHMHLYKTDNRDKAIEACQLPPSKVNANQQLRALSAMTVTDHNDRPMHGSLQYRLRIPARLCAAHAWSITLYDTQHCSMLITGQQTPVLGGHKPDLKKNADGSADIYFAPQPPSGNVSNWIQTHPESYWFAILRVVSQQHSWQARGWVPEDIECLAR